MSWTPRHVFAQRSGDVYSSHVRRLKRFGQVRELIEYDLAEFRTWLRSRPCACDYCGCELTAATFSVDHAQPLYRNGRHQFANLRVCCLPCNRAKSSLPEAEWRTLLGSYLLQPTARPVEEKPVEPVAPVTPKVQDVELQVRWWVKNGEVKTEVVPRKEQP